MGKMTTLVINAPDYMVKKSGKKSFEQVLADGIGEGYAIYEQYISKLPKGSKIVLLRKDSNKKRAEGILVRLEETGKYVNGVQRYNVHIKGLTEVDFKKENFNYNGVALIESDC